MSPGRFVERVEEEVRARDYDGIVAVSTSGDRLVVIFSWMGRSRLEYRLREEGDGFVARLEGQRLSPFHAPFKSSFEERFERVLAAIGATLV